MRSVKVLEQEKRRLEKKLAIHRGNLRDTGQDRYSNLVCKYEDEIIVIDRAIAALKEHKLHERRVLAMLSEIEKIMEQALRKDPHNDNLILAQYQISEWVTRWKEYNR